MSRGIRLLTIVLLSVWAGAFGRFAIEGAGQQSASSFSATAALRAFFVFEQQLWLETPGAKLVLKPLKRHPGNPVIRRGEGQAHDSHRVSWTSILPEGAKLRAWYGSLRSGAPYYEHAVSYAESPDGIHWTKPNLDVAQPGTNIVIRGASGLIVLPDPEGGYRGAAKFYREQVRQPGAEPGATFQFVHSRDGLHWNFTGKSSLPVRHFENYGRFQRDGLWWVLGQGVSPYFFLPDEGVHRRVMYGFHSENSTDFTLYPRPLFRYPANRYFPEASLQNHMAAGIWDRGRVLLGICGQIWPSGFSTTVRASLGLIYSYDGLNWTEPFPMTPILKPAIAGEWDGGMLMQVQRPVSRGDQTYFYYTGGDDGNVWSARLALGLAFLRRDGLAAYEAEGEKAQLITKALSRNSAESRLYLNSKGPVTVQMLNRYLQPISSPMTIPSDGIRTPSLDLAAVGAGEAFSLAFSLGPGSELYGFYFGPEPSRLPSLAVWE